MSTSDSDYSIDWLASDEEEDCESLTRLSPQPPLPPSSTTSVTASPRNCSDPGPTRQTSDCGERKDGCGCGSGTEGAGATEPSSAAALQGLTCVCKDKTAKRHSARKRTHSPKSDGRREKPQPEVENELFSQKCAELQCYIQPLSSILRRLRSGRYSERLSSFQESVAMDRIQRIMGVLQNPKMGGRFLSIVLKIEAMLRSWFPHMRADVTDDSTPAKKHKHHPSAAPPRLSLCTFDAELVLRASDGSLLGPHSTTHLKWLHTSPICSFKVPESMLGRHATSASAAPAHCSQRACTQDNAVSSSTDLSLSGPLRRFSKGAVPLKISSPCLVRLLQAKDSIIAPRTTGDASTSEQSWSS
ncbi:uncharacterized protein LOC143004553 isoform X2 [Genypterus blacodes]|uniref:uncharacterized protein LOC143004553 isoform X2 n=1 Tax=Genypterus blacodes TaxID=154954 RepID=UPI003F76FB07